ncbi:TetR/AcrR family transcriptional regulator [Clostridium oceanicum]|uniref:TetR/AcrR family transcriptional regulator n=1 Tax=Clostridium oceanicum TaxID=1543 RepID=A0ABP3UWK1_9CLOT
MNREEQNKISKQRILIASLKEFGEKEYPAASINNICNNNNISKGLLFHYYKNKDEIFLLCVKNLFMDLSDYLEKNFEFNNGNIEGNFKDYIKKRFEFFHEYPYYEQIFYTATFTPPKHLLYEITVLRKPIDEKNKDFWRGIVNHLNLKTNVIIEDVIETILGLGNYIHMKIQHNNSKYRCDESWAVEKYTKEYVDMINMLLYGIVK